MMYYFIPKQAERPVYSYRLSIVHFWALIFIYMWAGPHHLHYTALPDWAQTLGMVFSLMLLAPSWGGMINGIMTLSGAWHKLRTDPVLRMIVVVGRLLRHVDLRGADDVDQDRSTRCRTTPTGPSATCIPARSAGSAYISFGSLYCLVPRLWPQQMYSLKLVNWHFWIATIGIVLYIAAMWIAGRHAGPDVARLHRRSASSNTPSSRRVEAMYPFYVIRALGGAAVPRRHADHGLERLEDRATRREPAARRPAALLAPAE